MRRLIILAAVVCLVSLPLVLAATRDETSTVRSSATNTGITTSTSSSSSTTTSIAPPETSTTARPAPPVTSRSRTAARPAPPAVAPQPSPPATGATARATFYDEGQGTANGERFNPDGLTFAHRSMAFGTHVRFCHGGRCVDARCNDRGPFVGGVTFDLSRGAFGSIAPLSAGVITVTWAVV